MAGALHVGEQCPLSLDLKSDGFIDHVDLNFSPGSTIPAENRLEKPNHEKLGYSLEHILKASQVQSLGRRVG